MPISNLASMGGMEKHSWRVALAFARHGHRVTVLTTGPVTPPLQAAAPRVITLRPRPLLSVRHIRLFDRDCRRWLAGHGADVICGQDRNTFLTHCMPTIGTHRANLRQRRYYSSPAKRLSYRLNPLHRTINAFEERQFSNPALELVLPNSHMVEEEVAQQFGWPRSRMEVIRNGVEHAARETEFHAWPDARRSVLARHGLPAGHRYLLFVGNNFRRKGLAPLLEGFAALADAGVTLLVAGTDKHARRFHARARRLGIEASVRFLGYRTDVTSWLQVADACVVPSFYDPLANVTLESLAMGVPVVSSRWNGGHEVLSEVTGVVIDDLLDPSSVAAALGRALSRPKTTEVAAAVREESARFELEGEMDRVVASVTAGTRDATPAR